MNRKKIRYILPFSVAFLFLVSFVLFVQVAKATSNPTIGEFQAPTTVYANEWFFLNATVDSPSGNATLVNATVQLSGSVILKWVNATDTFSVESDPNYYATLNSTACLRAIPPLGNATAYKLSWRVKFWWNSPKVL